MPGVSLSQSGAEPMADNEPGRVDKAFGYFQQVLGAVFDTAMPGGNAEQNPTHQAASPNVNAETQTVDTREQSDAEYWARRRALEQQEEQRQEHGQRH
jgi:hypothetical protein